MAVVSCNQRLNGLFLGHHKRGCRRYRLKDTGRRWTNYCHCSPASSHPALSTAHLPVIERVITSTGRAVGGSPKTPPCDPIYPSYVVPGRR